MNSNNDKINEIFPKLSNIIDFYRDIGVEESIRFKLMQFISRIGERFFQIEQKRELYLALFYMFYNSVLGQGAFAWKFWHGKSPTDQDSKAFSGYKLNIDQSLSMSPMCL